MRSERQSTLDPIRELRLRTWARLNHVPLADRDGTWHPIVHEEMDRCDSDRCEVSPSVPETAPPAEVWMRAALRASQERLEAERRELAQLKPVNESLAAEPIIADPAAATSDDWWSSETMISAYVPLPPGPFRLLDEAHEGVPAPHLAGIRPRVRDEASIGIPECW